LRCRCFLLSYTSLGWEECTDAALFVLLRDKLKSGSTEQAFELKDVQRLKKHLQQVRNQYFCMPNDSVSGFVCIMMLVQM
jgi:hypothetical protein